MTRALLLLLLLPAPAVAQPRATFVGVDAVDGAAIGTHGSVVFSDPNSLPLHCACASVQQPQRLRLRLEGEGDVRLVVTPVWDDPRPIAAETVHVPATGALVAWDVDGPLVFFLSAGAHLSAVYIDPAPGAPPVVVTPAPRESGPPQPGRVRPRP